MIPVLLQSPCTTCEADAEKARVNISLGWLHRELEADSFTVRSQLEVAEETCINLPGCHHSCHSTHRKIKTSQQHNTESFRQNS